MDMNKRLMSCILSLLLVFTTIFPEGMTIRAKAAEEKIVVSEETVAASSDYGLADKIQDGTILHCFDWKYNDIKAELPNIAKAGFTAVQTSPAQPGGGSGTWWWLYQPLGFYIGKNELGTKEELKSLCEEAEKYGIKVVVDVVANHLAGSHTKIQDDLKASQYWHTYGTVKSWADRYQVTHGEIGMPDLNSENSYVQQCVSKYIDELKSVGVDGIRWDAAKHIGLPSEGCNFWKAVTQQGLWHYGEILVGPDDRQSGNEGLMKEYTSYMTVTDSTYGKTLRDSFNSGQAPSSYGNWAARGISSNKLIYWSESHDTWSNNKDWGYSNGMSQNVIDRGYAVAASRNNISALYFSRPASTVKDNIKIGQKGSTHFTSPEVAAVNHFHNAMIGQKDYYSTSNGCAVVCREQGAVIVKGSGSGKVSVKNGGNTTAPGTYIDEITGNEWTVTKDTISGTIGSTGIAVVYNPKPAGPSASVTPGTQSYKTDTLTLTLNYKNATSGQYAIDGGEYQSFTDGQKITIGKDAAYGTQTKVTVKASDGTTTSEEETYTYTKVDPTQTQKIYFDNSSYKWSSVYCYIYTGDGTTAKEPAAWPGSKMTLDSTTGYYMLEVPEGFEDGKVIFTESKSATTKRYPADQKPGLSLEKTTKLFKANHVFEAYNQPVATKKPTVEPTVKPTDEPVVKLTDEPVVNPTDVPVANPTDVPVANPTDVPVANPTDVPVANPTDVPVANPTDVPVVNPTDVPVVNPTDVPVVNPIDVPVVNPPDVPVINPTDVPVVNPTDIPVVNPTDVPVVNPTDVPVVNPTDVPTIKPTDVPPVTLTMPPTNQPTVKPTVAPTVKPTVVPTVKPTVAPTANPTKEPEVEPTATPVPEVYSITYVLKGGTFEEDVITSYNEEMKVRLPEPVRNGYIFQGWYTESSYKKKVTTIKKGSTGDKTFYAKWQKVTAPSTPTISSAKKDTKNGKLTVKLKKKVSGAAGYELVYATNAKFTKEKKVVRFTGTSKTIKNLEKGTKYYIKVRAYKVDSAGNRVYGSYGKVLYRINFK